MDDDTRHLIRQICTRAGMIMEDVSPIALLGDSETRLLELANAATAISALVAAAAVLQSC